MPIAKDQYEAMMEKGEMPETVYTQEDIEAQKAEAIANVQKEWEEKHKLTEEELAKERKFRAEQATNFKLLKNMTEEEKAKLTAEQIEARKIAEQALEENKTLKDRWEAKEKQDAETKKESVIQSIVGNNKELRAKLEAEFANVAIEDVEQKVIAAAKLAGLYGAQNGNPLRSPMGGGSPPSNFTRKDDDKAAFFESEKGKAAMDIISKL